MSAQVIRWTSDRRCPVYEVQRKGKTLLRVSRPVCLELRYLFVRPRADLAALGPAYPNRRIAPENVDQDRVTDQHPQHLEDRESLSRPIRIGLHDALDDSTAVKACHLAMPVCSFDDAQAAFIPLLRRRSQSDVF